MDGPKASVSVDIDKQLLLKFKSMCVLKETTMSEEIEKLVRDWVAKDGNTQMLQGSQQAQPAAAQNPPAEATPEGGTPENKPAGSPGQPSQEAAPEDKAFL